MYEEYFPQRVAQLRMKKGVSARDMSLSLGQSEGYINRIENRKGFPSMQVFFYICEYFQITPKEFFDEGTSYPYEMNEMIAYLKKLDAKQFRAVLEMVKLLAGE